MSGDALPIDSMPELNPYRPDIPESIKGISLDLYEYLSEMAQNLREQHGKTQAGDTTFPWTLLTEVDSSPRYTLGSMGRFLHQTYGLIQARYVRFNAMTAGRPGTPVGFPSESSPMWDVTNDLSKSNVNLVQGIMASYTLPKNGEYGWIITNGINLQSIHFTGDRPGTRAPLVWGADGVVGASKSYAQVGVLLADSDVAHDGTAWLLPPASVMVGVVPPGKDFTPEIDDTKGDVEEVKKDYESIKKELETYKKVFGQTEFSYSILKEQVARITENGVKVNLDEQLQVVANFSAQAQTAAANAGTANAATQLTAKAVNDVFRQVDAFKDQTGAHVNSVTQMLNEATLRAGDAALSSESAAASALLAQEAAASIGPGGDAAAEAAIAAKVAAEAARDAAQGYSESASTAKIAAEAASTAAGESASAANSSATTATTKAGAAEASATQADTARAAAETARDGSVNAANTARGYRDESVTYRDDASNFAVTAQNASTQAGTYAAAAQTSMTLAVGASKATGNLLVNSDWPAGILAGWDYGTPISPSEFNWGINIITGDGTSPYTIPNESMWQVFQSTVNAAAAAYFDLLAVSVGVKPDQLYEFSAYYTNQRCDTTLYMNWYNDDGAYISTTQARYGIRNTPPGRFEWLEQGYVRGTPPAGASQVRCGIRKEATQNGQPNSWLFALRPMLCSVDSQTPAPVPYKKSSNQAVTTIQQESIVDALGRTSARLVLSAVAGGRAQLAIYADANGGGGVDIIGDVRIGGNLLVDGTITTTKIAPNSVTQMVAAEAGSQQINFSDGGEYYFSTVTLTNTSGGPVRIDFQMNITQNGQPGATWPTYQAVIQRVVNGAAVNLSSAGYLGRILLDSPPAGTVTYRVMVRHPTPNGSISGATTHIYSQLFALEVKR